MKVFNWNDENTAEMKKLWQEGLTATQIQAKLGCPSRSAVLGRIHRNMTPEERRRPDVRPAQKPRKAPASTGVCLFEAEPAPPPPPKPALSLLKPLPAIRRKRVTKTYDSGKACGILEVTGCRYAVRADSLVIGGQLFCNAPTISENIKYCSHHREGLIDRTPSKFRRGMSRA